MSRFKFLLLVTLFLQFGAFSQNKQDKGKAYEIATEALRKMDKGELDESIKMLEQAQKLDKDNIAYPYEIALAYVKKTDYKKAIEILENLRKDKKAPAELYVLLGSAYDMDGNPDKALEIYNNGMELFPSYSGKLYLECGVVEIARERYDEAIEYWEKGIKADPYHPSNYYWLSKVFSMTEENIWTLMYGEMFLNLERDSERTQEISKLVYDTYLKTYTAKSDTEGMFNITKNVIIDAGKGSQLPFELSYAMAFSVSAPFYEGINIKKIYEAKKNILNFWFDTQKLNKDYPNSLLSMEKKMLEDGVLEAYVYWTLLFGNTEEFKSWYESHEDDIQKFATWTETNHIKLDKGNLYSRLDYK